MKGGRRTGGRAGGDEPDLHGAARSGDLSTVKSILSSNPLAVNNRDKHSRTPLHLAAWAGQTDVVSYLCKHKADVGAAAMDDMGAIHFAAQKGHLEVIQTLLSSGVSIKASTRKGLTPLHYAIQGSYLDLVKYLVKKGASLAAKNKAGKTPVDLASNEEIRLFLEEWERKSKDGTSHGIDKAEDSNPKPSLPDTSENVDGDSTMVEHDEQAEDETVKRKAEEDITKEVEDETVKRKAEEDMSKEVSLEPKRARVALNHLLSADDTQEDEG